MDYMLIYDRTEIKTTDTHLTCAQRRARTHKVADPLLYDMLAPEQEAAGRLRLTWALQLPEETVLAERWGPSVSMDSWDTTILQNALFDKSDY